MTTADRYAGMSPTLDSPAVGGAAVAPSDTATIEATKAVWVGGAGNLKVTYLDGATDTLTGVPAGTMLRIRVTKVWATGTTATTISALY